MRRVGLAVLVGLALAACGGSDGSAPDGAAPEPAPPEQAAIDASGPTAEQAAFRAQLVEQLESGTYGPCGCTAALRARERVESGKVKAPDPDRLVSNLP